MMCSPRAWGSTERTVDVSGRSPVFPTPVGVDRRRFHPTAARRGVPHARGGGPPPGPPAAWGNGCSPRAWGWTVDRGRMGTGDHVFPTRVGVDRGVRRLRPGGPRVPHARGGGPARLLADPRNGGCSPRAWGWTVLVEEGKTATEVFPTRVGVDRARRRASAVGRSVFPTRVGVDRGERQLAAAELRVPHARGGGPMYLLTALPSSSCSPRAWGWTAKDRGDAPALSRACSPRAWGWTGIDVLRIHQVHVFPTRVGVDRGPRRRPCRLGRVPHARGGGPTQSDFILGLAMCSPRASGWTARAARDVGHV